MAGNPYLWSTTAATNASIDPDINFSEGQAPGSVNDSDRALMAGVAGLLKDNNATLTTAGSANAYTVTSNITFAALVTGIRLRLKANFTNTAAATLNFSPAVGVAFGAKAIRFISAAGVDVAISAGAIQNNGIYDFNYDSTANAAAGAWILLNPTVAGLELISTQTASASSTLDFTSGIDSTYDEYLFTFINILPATNAVNLVFQVSINAGVAWITTSTYFRFANVLTSTPASTPVVISTDTSVAIAGPISNVANVQSSNGELRLFRPSSSIVIKNFTWNMGSYDGSTHSLILGFGANSTLSPINGVRFAMSSGNITSGTIALYGIRKS